MNTQAQPELSLSFIVSSNYAMLKAALPSIYAQTQTPLEIYVVINTSQGENDPELKTLLTDYPALKLIINEKRLGFAANHNQVLRRAEGAYIALLNDDIILQNSALDILTDYLRAHPDVGLVGPQLYNEDGSYQVSAYSDPSLFRTMYKMSGLAILTRQDSLLRKLFLALGGGKLLKAESLQIRTAPQDVDIIKGVAMLVRREVGAQVGGMDESTAIYGEEADWHLRIRRAGWRVVLVPQAHITHFGLGQVKLRLPPHLLIEDRKSNLLYFLNHRPKWEGLVIRAAMLLSGIFWGVVWLIPNRKLSAAHFKIARLALGNPRQ